MAKKKSEPEEKPRADPKAEERRRLKSLALSRGLLSSVPSRTPSFPLRPSATALKHGGKDIVKKGHRKNRFLFSFPGFLAPIASAGRVGELADLATGNPVLYLDFPKGRMKLFGTIVYPKNRYLTLRFARKNVLCEDSFDTLVIFSDAWWIGTKEENPQEIKLNFPRELIQEKYEDCDFQGGAGVTSEERTAGDKISKEFVEPLSPDAEPKGYISEDSNLDSSNHIAIANNKQLTPVRQSTRTSGKNLNYAEGSSEDESISTDMDMSDTPIKKEIGSNDASVSDPSKNIHILLSNSKSTQKTQSAEEVGASSPTIAEETSSKSKRMLVQTTLSTLFQKAAEKDCKLASDENATQKGSTIKRQRENKKPSPNKQQAHTPKKQVTRRKKSGVGSVKKQKYKQVIDDEDEIEDISSDKEDMDASDEDWVA